MLLPARGVEQPHVFDKSNCSKLVGVYFIKLRGNGDVFSSGSWGWKHMVRLIKAFGLFCFVLSLIVLKVVLL